jgi:prophage antirepressor-like protein
MSSLDWLQGWSASLSAGGLFQSERSPIKHKVCTLDRLDKPCLVLADICSVLKIANTWDVASRLDNDEKSLTVWRPPGALSPSPSSISLA